MVTPKYPGLLGRQVLTLAIKGTMATVSMRSSVTTCSELAKIKRQLSTHVQRIDQGPEQRDESGPTLLPEQQEVVNQALAGRNIFFTGSAGCGKSTVLREVRRCLEETGRRVHVMAPTGIVALAINGTTTWSFAGWSPNSNRIPLDELPLKTQAATKKRLRGADVIIIDEISMIENNFFERLDFLLSNVNVCDGAQDDNPFGGTQIIVTGDFCQLPPVKPFQHCVDCGRELQKQDGGSSISQRTATRICDPCGLTFNEVDKFAFSSAAWGRCNFVNIYLKTVHRQKDPAFISLLQKCRLGLPFSEDEVAALTCPKPALSRGQVVKLFPLRADVRLTNHVAFERLQTASVTFTCQDDFVGSEEHKLQYGKRLDDGTLARLDEHSFERQLNLKKGMRVILLSNLDLGAGLCNGSQGEITGFESITEGEIPTCANGRVRGEDAEIRERLISEFATAHKRRLGKKRFGWPIVKFDNGQTRTIYPDCKVNQVGFERPYSLACRTQIPLTAGYALSIHKAQGMTLEKVIVDVSKVFEEKQIYVALSRAKSLEGLQVVGLTRGGVICDDGDGAEKVRKFLRETFGDEAVRY